MKKFLGFLIFLLCFASLFAIAGFLGLGVWLSPQSKLAKSDVIVAISGGETQSRAEEAIKLYKDGWAPKIIFSGAAEDTSGPSNAAAMSAIAIEKGVPAKDILLEEVSQNTTQNALAVADIIKARSYKQIILVTSPYHQRRAYLSFRTALGSGVGIVNHSAVDHSWRRLGWWTNEYSYKLTVTELQKNLFVIVRD